MRQKIFSFNRAKEFENGEYVSFLYEGAAQDESCDFEYLNKQINDFIEGLGPFKENDMWKNIEFLRTVLRNLEERKLIISYGIYNNPNHVKKLSYEDGCLVFYEYKAEHKRDEKPLHISYEKGKEITVKSSDSSDNSYDLLDYQNVNSIIKRLNEIHHLSNIKPVEINIHDKILVQIYEQFYNEIPDFSSENINDKVQAMMSILAMYNISHLDDSSFERRGIDNIPSSSKLEYQVFRLRPFGKSINDYNDIKLSNFAANIIKIVGDTIRESIGSEDDMVKSLNTISKVIYGARYNLTKKSNIKGISEYMNCTYDEINDTMELFDCIDYRTGRR